MKRGRHYLHCTGSGRIVLDLRGTYLRSPGDLAAKARQRLRGLIAALPNGLDWSTWMVDVHDANGRHVVYVDFEPQAADAAVISETKGSVDAAADELPDSALRAEAQAADTGAAGGGPD